MISIENHTELQKNIGGMQLRIVDNHEAMSSRAANLICTEIANAKGMPLAKPGPLFCAATGNTPGLTYRLMAEAYRNGPGLFEHFRVLKLDEWGGLPVGHPGTCETYLQKHLLGPMHIPGERYFGCQSDATDPQEECGRMRQVMEREGPIDLCLLGLGLNGHLGLNEPGDYVSSHWHIAKLAPQSLKHPMIDGAGQPPAYGLTAGMGDILQSRHILLLVSSASKKEALKRMFERKVSAQFPASFLWLHGHVTLICDREAAEGLCGLHDFNENNTD